MSKTILVVDDQPDNLELMRYLLSRCGHDVVTAEGGKNGLARAQAIHPELILIDLHMPDMDGRELASRIRDDESLAGTRLMAISVGAADLAELRAAGFDGLFPMPFEPASLISMVDGLLEPPPAE